MKNKLLKTIIMLSKCFLYGFVLQTLMLNLVIAMNANGQYKTIEEVRVSLSADQLTLDRFFREVQRQTPFKFSFENRDMERNLDISFAKKEGSVMDLLKEVSIQTELSFRQINHGIDVLKKEGKGKVLISSPDPITISGTVTDENGQPIPGVTVSVPGSSIGTATDIDGKYSLSLPEASTLVFSFIGFQTQTVEVGNQRIVDIVLNEDMASLGEVVVVGYGSVKKSDLTGSIASIKSEEIKGLPVRSIAESIQGRVAGVMVNKSSGRPGSGSEIIIRGVGSINGLSPLFVVDGVISGNSPTFNPRDVESIEIIKDASAAAIYGARAAGGVVLVTTKRGSFGQKNKIQFTSNTGVRKISNSYKMLETDDYIRARNGIGDDYDLWDDADLPNTNWFDELFETGIEQSYLLSLSGGSEKIKYYLSSGYEKEEGIQKGNYWERYSIRLNADYAVAKNVTLGHQLYLAKVQQDPYTMALPWRTLPYMDVYNDDGTFAAVPPVVEFSGGNPIAELGYRHYKSRNLSVNSIFYLNWEIIPGLNFRTTGSGSFGSGYNDNFSEANLLRRAQTNENYTKSLNYSESYILNSTLTYERVFGEKHDFKIMGGYEVRNSHGASLASQATGFPVRVAESFALSTNNNKTASGGLSYGSFLSQFGRLNYMYDSKYILTANVRRDGSPKFGPQNRWGVFPSVSAGWKINEERFFNTSFFDLLKPRISWGILGNDSALGNFLYQPSYQQVTMHSFDEIGSVGGFNSIRVVNENIKWEEIHSTDIGIDIAILNGKVTFNADYYWRNTKDMIYNLSIPLSSGIGGVNRNPSLMPVNIGSILNQGWEISSQYRNTLGDFNFSLGANLSHNENKVLDLGLPTAYIYSGGAWPLSSNSRPFITENGQPVGQLYGFIADGIIQSQEEIDGLNQTASEIAGQTAFYNHQYTGPGDLRFRDLDGDGRITAEDRTVIGNPWPKFQYGFNLYMEWKNFDLNATIIGIAGRDVMNDVKAFEQNFQQDFQSTYDIFNASYFLGNELTDQPRLGLFDPSGSGAYIEDPSKNYRYYSTYLVEDGSYMKIKNISIGYTFPKSILNSVGMDNLRIYLSGQNLFTFTKFTGLDPEFSNDVKNHGQYNTSTYPQTQLISFGLELGL
ncbi:TonB-dependent receptor [Cyclobacterium sp. 1_MG-2023]|uniref:SusC/RagA family TonB-linked outer membrane protein n=1 Tax=Cyclobacterium sp. 1_MG-2023 TaxID=3062681 RepID=UPI0026E39BF8|nr:TonB-dependent receptor [Cyclobacterium sp. 1_MG-2023]MDO6438999.1 TonB-dependent receptor [Cyclobacterium sp. 1_MG-2023]